MSQDKPSLLVEVTGNARSGTSSKGKPYTMYEAFVFLPGVPYPQMTSFYAETPQQCPQAGTYECFIVGQMRDGRLQLEIDPRQGRRVSTPAAPVKQA